MSGHSKWHNIKLRKGKADAQRGALFTKLSKEVILATRAGSPEPEANYRLKMAVEKARAANMPMDTIKRAIARAGGEGGERQIEEIRYEGYGPGGIAVVVDAATDNRNRTAAELRFLFSRHGGGLGETGSVGWMFDPRGIIDVLPKEFDEDRFVENALVDGVVDVHFPPSAAGDGEPAEVVTEAGSLGSVREALSARGLQITGMVLGMEPKTRVVPQPAELAAVLDFLEALDEHEDVQRVYSNVEIDDAQIEALGLGSTG
jgi:YebC/PmpR family DNA-binding regulatory protein